MNQCAIDVERSDRFKREFQALQQKYPHTVDDITELFQRVAQNPRAASKRGRYRTGTDHEVYKYDCKSTDLQKGADKAFRVIALFEPTRNLVTPLAIYLKQDRDDVPVKEVVLAINALRA